mmetsp:Transcript_35202/g.101196  ORF Transcript_35202/g.101196 Transcript_35202/m.101196 type:complete len:371 (-) Transcript_35202:30-1142(-)
MLARHRPMNEHQVDVAALQLRQCLVHLRLDSIRALVDSVVPNLGSEEEALAGHSGCPPSIADPRFVHVELGAIEHAVPCLQRIFDHLVAHLRAARRRRRVGGARGRGRQGADLVGAEAEQRHLDRANLRSGCLEAPSAGNGCSLGLQNRLAFDATRGLEVCPSLVVVRGLVLSRSVIVQVGLVEHEAVWLLLVPQKVKAKAARIKSLVARFGHIHLHDLEEIVDAVGLDVHGHEHRGAGPRGRRRVRLEGPAARNRGRVQLDDLLFFDRTRGLEVSPNLEVSGLPVLRMGVGACVGLVEEEAVRHFSTPQHVKAQASWVERLVSRAQSIDAHRLEEVLNPVLLDVHAHEHAEAHGRAGHGGRGKGGPPAG